MIKKINPETLLASDKDLFAGNVLRILRYVLVRMKAEGRKSWKHEDLIHLMEKLITEVSVAEREKQHDAHPLSQKTGQNTTPTSAPAAMSAAELPEERDACIVLGKAAFSQGILRADNPYGRGTETFSWWDIGWHDAERHKKAEGGNTVDIQSGRNTQIKKGQIYYRIQIKENSVINEWNEPLHQYTDEGNGTLFTDYDETQTLADQLAQGANGIVSVIAVRG